MASDPKLAADEAKRLEHHAEVKEQAASEVKAEIEQETSRDGQAAAEAAALGGRMRQKAVSEIEDTDREIQRGRKASRAGQIVDYIFGLVYSLLALEIVLELIGAREGNAFRNFVKTITTPFLAPFYALVPDPSAGRFQFRISYLVAVVVYILLHFAIKRFLRLATSKAEI